MEKFKKKSFSFEDIKNDSGVLISELIKLVENHKSFDDFYKLLEIEKIKDDFINIPGADKLVSTMMEVDNKFIKFDVESSYQNLEFDRAEDFSITFKNISAPHINELIESDEFTATPIYSAQTDFFSGLFSMDRYASKLLQNGHKDLVNSNLKSVQEIFNALGTKDKKYRILLDSGGLYYFRAITSNRYYDYNNNIAVFIGLIMLYKEMLTSQNKFIVQRCEYNESYVRVYFENIETRELSNVGLIKNIIEVSNDEIKREALRFSSVVSIIYGTNHEVDKYIYIKPQRTKSTILSIKHNVLPATAFEDLTSLSNYKLVQEDLFDDLKKIGDIKEPNQIKYLVRNKINRAQGELKKNKANILSELTQEVKTITELLEMMHKIEMLAEDIDSKEYLRYVVYEALIERK